MDYSKDFGLERVEKWVDSMRIDVMLHNNNNKKQLGDYYYTCRLFGNCDGERPC